MIERLDRFRTNDGKIHTDYHEAEVHIIDDARDTLDTFLLHRLSQSLKNTPNLRGILRDIVICAFQSTKDIKELVSGLSFIVSGIDCEEEEN